MLDAPCQACRVILCHLTSRRALPCLPRLSCRAVKARPSPTVQSPQGTLHCLARTALSLGLAFQLRLACRQHTASTCRLRFCKAFAVPTHVQQSLPLDGSCICVATAQACASALHCTWPTTCENANKGVALCLKTQTTFCTCTGDPHV